jgi:hypothetical protein
LPAADVRAFILDPSGAGFARRFEGMAARLSGWSTLPFGQQMTGPVPLGSLRTGVSWELEMQGILPTIRVAAVQAKPVVLDREVYDWFSEGFDTADLTDARHLLDVRELTSRALTIFGYDWRRLCYCS